MKRKIGNKEINAIGFGAMALSHAYGVIPTEQHSIRILNEALDLGYDFIDTATFYGFGENEKLIAKAIGHRRNEYMLASKCGLSKNEHGIREINNNPKVLKQHCEDSLRRLNTDVIDLYYLHRYDPKIPLEESIGILSDLVNEGKIKGIGLSEVSAQTIHEAHKIHPIMAVQTEYSLWTRNPEIAGLSACRELGIAFVAFSPVGRGFFADDIVDVDSLPADDFRKTMPRFNHDNYPLNLKLLAATEPFCREYQCSKAQLALAWLLTKGDDIISIPATTKSDHLADNFNAMQIKLSTETVSQLDILFDPSHIKGERYNEVSQSQVGTEKYEFNR